MTRLLLYIGFISAAIAVGLFIFVTGAPSYIGTDAATCNNCHVMDSQYENWFHGGHRSAAQCVDCHLPHDNPLDYYTTKARTGFHDVFAFTTGQIPVMIRAKADTQQIIQGNCIRCHNDKVENIISGPQPFDRHCWDCHRSVAHGDRGISIVPYQDISLYPAK